MRILKESNEYISDRVIKCIYKNKEDLINNLNTFLFINGGTGQGKTRAIMKTVKPVLDEVCGKPQRIALVESRTMTVEQLHKNYQDEIECINGIDVMQRVAFVHKLEQANYNYDWVVIDECHGLFSESGFAEDTTQIANWIDSTWRKTHVILISANDTYFQTIAEKVFNHQIDYTFVFPDLTEYRSGVKCNSVCVCRTPNMKKAITALRCINKGQKGIFFLRSTKEMSVWYNDLTEQGYRVGMVVSLANTTKTTLTKFSRSLTSKHVEKYTPDASITFNEVCQIVDNIRISEGYESVRDALRDGRLPDDIDILLSTDTLQEGININSPIDYMIVEDYEEVGVVQKRGRVRADLDKLYILFNPGWEQLQAKLCKDTFKEILTLYSNNQQNELAERYGQQCNLVNENKTIMKVFNYDTNEYEYRPNIYFYAKCAEDELFCNMLLEDPEIAAQAKYGILSPNPIKINTLTGYKQEENQLIARQIAERLEGVPLIGFAEKEMVDAFVAAGIQNSKRESINTAVKCRHYLETLPGITITKRKSTKKDLLQWPEYIKETQKTIYFIEIENELIQV